MNENEQLRKVAQTFRNGILSSAPFNYLSLNDFPKGSCGDASILLGEFFFNNGFGIWLYTSGRRFGCEHAWLERDGVFVDITADQFEEVEEEVIVTTSRDWFNQFDLEISHNARIDDYDEESRDKLRTVYDIILNNI